MTIPVIDLFAGPGGLGEGFAACRPPGDPARFRVALSIESDPVARETLRLRAFYRQFAASAVPEEYYEYLRGEMQLQGLYELFSEQAQAADREAWLAELGRTPAEEIDSRLSTALAGEKHWVLIGGPPCQAYSVIGRSRVGGVDAEDHRVHLYREYLRILAVYRPAVFVMEKVRGILSARVGDQPVFSQILKDLQEPNAAIRNAGRGLTDHSRPKRSMNIGKSRMSAGSQSHRMAPAGHGQSDMSADSQRLDKSSIAHCRLCNSGQILPRGFVVFRSRVLAPLPAGRKPTFLPSHHPWRNCRSGMARSEKNVP